MDHRPIRIAYLSGDFHQHATSELIAGLIERHDRAQFQVTGISFSKEDGSAIRKRIVRRSTISAMCGPCPTAKWRNGCATSEFDIAVDLKGHTEGSRPAFWRTGPVRCR
jgi:predicted O-linked N-acetylglucosamine transferase (SPINDLY family)